MEKLQVGITGNIITIKCHAKGNPLPVAVWLKNGRKMNNTRRVKILSVKTNILHNTTLTIEKIEYRDSANYTCEFINAFGVANSSGTLLVHGEFFHIQHGEIFHTYKFKYPFDHTEFGCDQ